MAQFFRGNLAGLTIRSGKLESKKVIDCLYTCKEGLDLPTADGAAKGLKVRTRLTAADRAKGLLVKAQRTTTKPPDCLGRDSRDGWAKRRPAVGSTFTDVFLLL